MNYVCMYCRGELFEHEEHICPVGSYATLKVSRATWDLFLLRAEAIIRVLEEEPGDVGYELTRAQRVKAFEIMLGLLDVPDEILRDWLESGERR